MTTTKMSEAIAIAESDMVQGGFKHGPCIHSRPIGAEDSTTWAVEFAYDGETGRSETTDPPSILLQINLVTREVRLVDLM